jgi:hypothetical protein
MKENTDVKSTNCGWYQVSTFCGIEQLAPCVRPWRLTVPSVYDGFEPKDAKSQIKGKRETKSHRQKEELLGTLDAGTMSHIVTGVDATAWVLSPGYYAHW